LAQPRVNGQQYFAGRISMPIAFDSSADVSWKMYKHPLDIFFYRSTSLPSVHIHHNCLGSLPFASIGFRLYSWTFVMYSVSALAWTRCAPVFFARPQFSERTQKCFASGAPPKPLQSGACQARTLVLDSSVLSKVTIRRQRNPGEPSPQSSP
jgi:hypothetical protein